ncbi:hypothetical protein BVX95_00100 [archaeon D22]|nr:hypothetical protein BVX95_00100 [archaeon D22]
MNDFLRDVLLGFWEIIKSPSKDWSVLWLLAPIFLFWIILEVYFDRHKKEPLGWNTALGNGLSLFWVAISCVRFFFTQDFEFWKMFWIFVIFGYSIFIIWISFNHKIKDKIFFPMASPTPTYFFSMVVVLLAYGVLEFSWIIILDLFLLYWIILAIELTVRHFMPEANSHPENDTLDGGAQKPPSDPFASSGSSSSDPFGSQSSDPFGNSSSGSNSKDPFGGNDDFKF